MSETKIEKLDIYNENKEKTEKIILRKKLIKLMNIIKRQVFHLQDL